MKIVIVSHYRLPHTGGIEFVIHQLGQRFAADGHQVVCITSGRRSGSTVRDGITYVDVPAWNPLERFGIPYPLFSPPHLIAALRSALEDADVLHAHGLLYLSSTIGVWLARQRGLRIVAAEHVGFVDYHSHLINWVERIAFATIGRFGACRADVLVVLNRQLQEEMRPLVKAGTPIEKIVNGVDTTLFCPPTPAEKADLRARRGMRQPVVLFVGRLVKKKGIDIVLAAADDSFETWVCGPQSPNQSIAGVHATGSVEQDVLRELYQSADLFVLPSADEGFPLAVQEALACGLPVIVSDNPTNREFLDDSVAVFVERSPEHLRAAIHALLADDSRREQMGRAARQYAVEHFDWEQTKQQYLALSEPKIGLRARLEEKV